MAMDPRANVTVILNRAAQGDPKAAKDLLPLVYEELRKLAAARMAGAAPGQTLQATALVHEAYVRLVGGSAESGPGDPGWNSRGHFFGAAAQAMRNVLVDHARRRGAVKRGGGQKKGTLEENAVGFESSAEQVLELDELVKRLEAEDPRKAEIVTMKFFVGMTNAEIAAAMGVTERTVERDWRFARAWLRKEWDGMEESAD